MTNPVLDKEPRDIKHLYRRKIGETYEEFSSYIDSLEPVEIGSYHVSAANENEAEHRLYPEYQISLPSNNIYIKKFSKLYIKIKIMYLLSSEIDEKGNEGPMICHRYGFIPMGDCKIYAKLRVGIGDYVYVDASTLTGINGKLSCKIIVE